MSCTIFGTLSTEKLFIVYLKVKFNGHPVFYLTALLGGTFSVLCYVEILYQGLLPGDATVQNSCSRQQ